MQSRATLLQADAREWSPVRWAVRTWFWLALCAVFVALEFWVDPLLASFVVCLKLGWHDAWASHRIRRNPNAIVARAIACYLLAQACFKIAFGSVALASIAILIEVFLGGAPRFERLIIGSPLVILVLFAGWFLVGLAAGHSVNHRLSIWLDGTIYEKLSREPPQIDCDGTWNRVPLLLVVGILLVSGLLLPAPITAILLIALKGVPWGIPGGIAFSFIWYLFAGAMYRALKQTPRSASIKILVST